MYDNTVLTSALASLDAANKAKDTFLTKTVLEDKELAKTLSLDPETDTAATVETAIGTYYTTKAGILDSIDPKNSFGTLKAAQQDTYIAAEKDILTDELSDAKAELKKGSDKLIEAAISKAEALDAAKDAAKEAEDSLKDGINAYNGLNAVATGDKGYVPNDFSTFNEDATTGVVTLKDNVSGTPNTLATRTDGEWTLTTDGKALKGLKDVLDAYDANEAEIANYTAALEALKSAVAEVYKKENDYHTILDPESALSNEAIANSGTATTINFARSVKAIKTEASAKSVQKFTVDLTTEFSKSDAKFAFDGIDVSFDATNEDFNEKVEQVDKIIADINGNTETASGVVWTVSSKDSSNVLTFLADKAAPTVVNPVLTETDDAAAATITEVKSGQTVKTDLTATKADDVVKAIVALDKFNEDVAAFLEARGLKDKVDGYNDDIDTIEEWFDDNGYISTTLSNSDSKIATSDSDIYFVSALNSGDSASIKNFGALFGEDGGDYLYASSDYKNLTVLDSKFDVTKSFGGDVSALDVFAIEKNGNTTLYFETNEVDGQLNGTSNMFTVTLNGVKAEDLVLEDGFITIA